MKISIESLFINLWTMITDFSLADAIDIILVSFIIYRILLLIKSPKIIYMLMSLFVLFILFRTASAFDMHVTSWVLNNVSGFFFLMLVVIFQPELRRTLAVVWEKYKFFQQQNRTDIDYKIVDELARSASLLANKQIGALIIIPRREDVSQFMKLGPNIDSLVSKELLLSVFIHDSPLHDGAVLLKGDRLTHACCTVQTLTSQVTSLIYGTRHRAALGITEQTDAIAIVVSEERGTIVAAENGKFTPELDHSSLTSYLSEKFAQNRKHKNEK